MSCGRRTVAYVYNGLGVSTESLAMLMKCLTKLLKGSMYKVQPISPEEIKQGLWRDTAALLAIGGGYDRGYISALGTEGASCIRGYVSEGGSYLGLCAGAYYACKCIEFDKGGPLEVCGDRDLQFYPGQCTGPTFPGFRYNSHEGAQAARIRWTREISDIPDHVACYYNGGGHFCNPSETKSWTTLAVYADVENTPPAIVQCTVGKGLAVLCSVHPEYQIEDLDHSDPTLSSVLPALQAMEQDSIMDNMMRYLLDILGLKIDVSQKV